jgi:hypothetical protein
MRPRRDRGTVGLAVTWWGLAMLVLALAGVAGGADLAATQASARTAADAAALAGAGAHPLAGGAGDACQAAARLARANGARLASCEVTGTRPSRLRVAVRVAAEPTTAVVRDTVGSVEAAATAGLARAAPAAGGERVDQ